MRQLALILRNQFDILERVIQDAFADTTTPRQRLAIYQYLTKRMDDLEETMHANSGNASEIDELLKGSKLVQAESRFSASVKEIPLRRTGQTDAYVASI
ncbi:hypothetical protein ACFLXI_06460 [Chloroflexota bacterium]